MELDEWMMIEWGKSLVWAIDAAVDDHFWLVAQNLWDSNMLSQLIDTIWAVINFNDLMI